MHGFVVLDHPFHYVVCASKRHLFDDHAHFVLNLEAAKLIRTVEQLFYGSGLQIVIRSGRM